MEPLPLHLYTTFFASLLASLWLFARSMPAPRPLLLLAGTWIAFQTLLGLNGFYEDSYAMPPRFPVLLIPPAIFMLIQFNSATGKARIDGLSLKGLTLLHSVRLPVEIVLHGLYLHHAIPELMTYEGRNFDILTGLTAPLMYYFVFVKPVLSRKILLIWNLLGLALLVNVVGHGLLSTPTFLQKLAFELPNVAVLHYPFLLLPAFIVPLVLFAHLAAIRQLLFANPGSKHPIV